MKQQLSILCGALLLLGSSCTPPKAKEVTGFIHGTYSVGSRLANPDEIKQSDFKSFQFVYLMAAPKWEMADFNKNQSEINDKYITNHQYPAGEEGNALVPALIRKVHEDGSKILISFPGTDEFPPIVSDNEKRQKFANMMAEFAKKYDYDGIEIDWEHTLTLESHLALMKDIRSELNKLEKATGKTYYLTTALNSVHRYPQSTADSLSQYIDWVNVMMYDMGGGIWNDSIATHNTPTTQIKEILKDKWSVFDPQKICIGLASYGFYYKGIAPNVKAESQLKDYGRYFDYNELPALLANGWTEEYDSIQDVPYFFSPDKNEFVTIDNHLSLEKKMDWVKEENYKGVFWWEFHSDYKPATQGNANGTHYFMDFVSDYINKNITK